MGNGLDRYYGFNGFSGYKNADAQFTLVRPFARVLSVRSAESVLILFPLGFPDLRAGNEASHGCTAGLGSLNVAGGSRPARRRARCCRRGNGHVLRRIEPLRGAVS